jgi:hypothetical protein
MAAARTTMNVAKKSTPRRRVRRRRTSSDVLKGIDALDRVRDFVSLVRRSVYVAASRDEDQGLILNRSIGRFLRLVRIHVGGRFVLRRKLRTIALVDLSARYGFACAVDRRGYYRANFRLVPHEFPATPEPHRCMEAAFQHELMEDGFHYDPVTGVLSDYVEPPMAYVI